MPNNDWIEFKKKFGHPILNESGHEIDGLIQVWFREQLTLARRERDAEVKSMISNLRQKNESSGDYQTGEHWATYGYGKALDDVLSVLSPTSITRNEESA